MCTFLPDLVLVPVQYTVKPCTTYYEFCTMYRKPLDSLSVSPCAMYCKPLYDALSTIWHYRPFSNGKICCVTFARTTLLWRHARARYNIIIIIHLTANIDLCHWYNSCILYHTIAIHVVVRVICRDCTRYVVGFVACFSRRIRMFFLQTPRPLCAADLYACKESLGKVQRHCQGTQPKGELDYR